MRTEIAFRIAAVAAILLGLTGLAGWLFDSQALKIIIPGGVAIKANTAALLAFCGAALLLLRAGPGTPHYALKRRAAFFLAALAVLTGLLTILEYVYGFNFGLDQILFIDDGGAFALYPGRMAAATALCFVLTGLGILLADVRVQRWTFSASEKIALAVLLTAFHSLIDFLYSIVTGTLSNQVTPMAPHTAAAFMFLSVGLILARPGGFVSILSGRGIPRMLVLLTLPAAFIVPAAFGWLRLLGQNLGFYDSASGVALTSVFSAAALIAVILYAVKVVKKMGEELQASQLSANNALREQAEMLEMAGRLGRFGAWSVDLATNICHWSDEVARIHEEPAGFSPTLDKGISYYPPEWQQKITEVFGACARDGVAYDEELEIITAKGNRRWVRAIGQAERDAAGRIIKVTGSFQDITERKKSEEELKERGERINLLLESAAEGIYGIDLDGNCTFSNKAASLMLGYDAEELLGRNMHAAIHSKYPDGKAYPVKDCTIYRALTNSQGTHCDSEVLWRADDSCFAAEYWSHPQFRDGKITGAVVSFIDITERKKADEQIRFQADIIENSPVIAAYHDRDLNVVWVNRAYQKATGLSLEEVRGRKCYQVWKLSGPCRGCPVITAIKTGESAAAELTPDNQDNWPETQGCWLSQTSPVRDEQGTVIGALEFAIDITERKRIEAELLKAKAGAEAANQAKRNFLSKMSHEIRTPMNAILGFTQLMRRDPAATGPQAQRLDIINRSGEHLLELINEVLDISRIESGQLTLNKAAFDLHAMLEDLEKLFMAKAEAKNLRLELEILKEVPRFLHGDGGKLRQVIANIISNAVKFTERGGVSLRVRAESLGGGSFRLEAEVQDSGPGMTPEEAAALFKPFEQTQAGRKEGSGTGLGLAISREYSWLMGGSVEVASRPGEGSTFKISVIMEEAGQADVTPALLHRHVKALERGQLPCRVLIADDKEDNRIFLSELLGMVGFETRMVADGEQVLKEFAVWGPRLILMDLRMPGMDGYESMKRLRAMENGKEVKIIAVSASAFTEVQQEALASGADEFIAKPFRESELFEKIGKLTGVQYVYENIPGLAQCTAEEPLAADLFADCPGELLDRIKEAALDCDFDAIAGLADQVEPVNLKAARGLRALAQKYDSKSILKAVPAGKP